MNKFKIRNKIIGDYARPFIIAEAGINHRGDFKTAEKMVEAAYQIGADAVTFQHIDAADFNVSKNNVEYWNRLRLTDSQMASLFRSAKKKGLLVTACVINKPDLDLITSLRADFIKIVSGDITCHPFLKECAKTGLPIFLSTGASELNDVKEAVRVITSAGNKKLTIYHTCTNYPTPPEEVNLNIIDLYKKEFNFPIGYCDHTEGDFIPLIAVSKGIVALEKHLTLDRSDKGPDYEVSLTPEEFKAMMVKIKLISLVKGEAKKYILKSEKNKYLNARRSIVAKTDIPRGTRIGERHLAYKRPGFGLQANRLGAILGKKSKMMLRANEYITKKKVEK